jgi:hypothetical protein
MKKAVKFSKSAVASADRGFFLPKRRPLTDRNTSFVPFPPAPPFSRPPVRTNGSFHGPPAESKFVAAKRFGVTDLTSEEEAEFSRELSAAYYMDEAAASRRDIQRIAEKVRARLAEAEATPTQLNP